MQESTWNGTQAGTDSGATVTQAADANRGWIVSCISGHVDLDTLITITDGSTTLWESKIDVSAEGFSFIFDGINVVAGTGNAAVVAIAGSNADCQLNVTGHSIP